MAVGQAKDSGLDYQSLYHNLSAEHSQLARAATEAAKEAELTSRRLETELRTAREDLDQRTTEMRDVKDSADLLEFRLLELEQRESRERTPELIRKVERGTGTDSEDDSGCPSLTSVEDLLDVQKDFRNEKIGDT